MSDVFVCLFCQGRGTGWEGGGSLLFDSQMNICTVQLFVDTLHAHLMLL